MILILNVASLGLVLLLTTLFSKGKTRIQVVGWISAGVNIGTFVAPLSIIVRNSWITVHAYSLYNFAWLNQWSGDFWFFFMLQKRVIETRSVEYMPFNLSFFLTICATMWFFYGIFVRDFFIAVSNISLIMEHGLLISFQCAKIQSWYHHWISRYLMWWDLYSG